MENGPARLKDQIIIADFDRLLAGFHFVFAKC